MRALRARRPRRASCASAPPPARRCSASAWACSCCSSPPTEHEGADGPRAAARRRVTRAATRRRRSCRTSAGTSSRFARASRADRGPRRARGLLPRALASPARPADEATCVGTRRVRRALRLDRRARQRVRRAVPPREVLARRAARCCATSRGCARRCAHDPLPGDRHPRRQGRAPASRAASRTQTVYHDDPLEAARSRGSTAGARFLHVVDLDGARAGAPQVARPPAPDRRTSYRRARSSTAAACARCRRSATRCAAGAERVIVGTAAFTRRRLPRRRRSARSATA